MGRRWCSGLLPKLRTGEVNVGPGSSPEAEADSVTGTADDAGEAFVGYKNDSHHQFLGLLMG